MEFSLNCDIIWSPVPFKRKQEGFGGNIAHDFPERPNVVLPTMCACHTATCTTGVALHEYDFISYDVQWCKIEMLS